MWENVDSPEHAACAELRVGGGGDSDAGKGGVRRRVFPSVDEFSELYGEYEIV